MSRASGAAAYVQSFGTGVRFCLRSTSVNGEVVRALVRPRPLLAQLHQHVIEQGRGAQPVEVGREPVRAQRLVQLDEVLDGLLRLADSACRLHSDASAGFL